MASGGDGRTGIVFVHGFLSSAATWDQFLQLIREDHGLAGFVGHAFGYPSPRMRLHLLRRIPDLDDIADRLGTFLAHQVGDLEHLVLVSHSQGGLVVQRFLARTLGDGRGHELARIRQVVMFACPNAGSALALRTRGRAWFWPHPQERALRPLDREVARAKQVVLNRVVHATGVAADRCHIPVMAYAADSDAIVPRSSAWDVFPDTGMLPGDHFSVIQPDSPAHPSYLALKHHLHRLPRADPTPPPPTSGPAMAATGVGQVLDRLLAVPRMAEPAFREQVYALLPAAVVHQLRRDGAARVELAGLVGSFDHYPHLSPWKRLIAALDTLQPDQPAVGELAATLREQGLLATRR